MIVTRKPWLLYDVDLIGALGAVVLSVAAGWFVFARWQQTWTDYRELTAARSTAQAELQTELHKLKQYETGLAQLREAVESQIDRAPSVGALSAFLRELTDIARDVDLEVLSVTPQPLTTEGPYLVSDIPMGGRGRSRDFVRFLDRLASSNPHQMLTACSITRPVSSPDALCELKWTVRLYLLPEAQAAAQGAN